MNILFLVTFLVLGLLVGCRSEENDAPHEIVYEKTYTDDVVVNSVLLLCCVDRDQENEAETYATNNDDTQDADVQNKYDMKNEYLETIDYLYLLFSAANDLNISKYGIEVAVEFLSTFWSVFNRSMSWYHEETGVFYSHRDPLTGVWIESDPSQLFYWGGYHSADNWRFVEYNGRIFNALGYELTDVPFIRAGDNPWFPLRASQFRLFDFDNSGIPDIVINFFALPPDFEGCLQGVTSETLLFRYHEGVYHKVGLMPNFSFSILLSDEGVSL